MRFFFIGHQAAVGANHQWDAPTLDIDGDNSTSLLQRGAQADFAGFRPGLGAFRLRLWPVRLGAASGEDG
jgi:hypothetical protein